MVPGNFSSVRVSWFLKISSAACTSSSFCASCEFFRLSSSSSSYSSSLSNFLFSFLLYHAISSTGSHLFLLLLLPSFRTPPFGCTSYLSSLCDSWTVEYSGPLHGCFFLGFSGPFLGCFLQKFSGPFPGCFFLFLTFPSLLLSSSWKPISVRRLLLLLSEGGVDRSSESVLVT